MLSNALLRKPGPEIVDGLSKEPHERVNVKKAIEQHQSYASALKRLGVFPIIAQADPRFPDGCFTEDTHLILPELVIALSPGAPSRALEPASLRDAIPNDRPYKNISKELTIDGGDILVADKRIYVGLSTRTVAAAVDQLKQIVSPYGYTIIPIPLPLGLHLKSGMTCINANTFVIQAAFEKIFKQIHQGEDKQYFVVPATENFAANVLPLNDGIIIPPDCPKTKAFISKFYPPEKILEVDTSEFRKIDGALTCLSLPYQTKMQARL